MLGSTETTFYAFSDGKLSLCSDVGGDLPTLVGEQKAQELIDYADSIYLEFGADEHVEGLENTEEIKRIRTRAIRAGLRLVDCPIRHLGTEKAHEVYLGIENYLRDHGVEMLFGCTCEDVILRDGRCCGVVAHDGHQDYTIEARHTVIATGRRGADWWRRSASRTVWSTSPARSTSACASRCATRSWSRSTACCMSPSSSATGPVQEQGAHVLPEPRRLRVAGELRQ